MADPSFRKMAIISLCGLLFFGFQNCGFNSDLNSKSISSSSSPTDGLGVVTTPPAVNLLPKIITPIAIKRAQACANYEISIEAQGVNPLQYKWFRNGVAVLSATPQKATLTLPIDDPDFYSSYKVSVTDINGTVMSEALTPTMQFIKAVKVSTGGGYHRCATYDDGKVRCSGNNMFGQLGDRSLITSPVPLVNKELLSEAIDITAGPQHTCALTKDGPYCWGHNNNGQFGDDTLNDSLTPVPVKNLKTGVTKIVAGGVWGSNGNNTVYDNGFTCALKDGAVFCWGYSTTSVIGPQTNTSVQKIPVAIPVLTANVVDLAAGYSHACAVQNNQAYCWGGNGSDGRLGDGSTVAKATPVLVQGLSGNVTAIGTGYSFSCAIAGEKTYCWGSNSNGQMGQPAATLAKSLTPVEVPGMSEAIKLSVTDYSGCVVKKNFEVWCWGMAVNSPAPKLIKKLSKLPDSIGVLGMGGAGSVSVVTDGFIYAQGSNMSSHMGLGAGAAVGTGLSCLDEKP